MKNLEPCSPRHCACPSSSVSMPSTTHQGGTWASEVPPQPASSSQCSGPLWGFSRQQVDSRGLLHRSTELRSDQRRAQWVIVLGAGGRHLAWLSPLVPPLVLNDSIALFSLVSLSFLLLPPTHTTCLLRCKFSPQTK